MATTDSDPTGELTADSAQDMLGAQPYLRVSQETAVRVCIDFNFEVIGEVSMEADAKLHFPPLPTTPGVYRFRLLGLPDSGSTYKGETDNLRRRTYHYRNPGPTQQTNIRMEGRIRSHLASSGTVELATARSASRSRHF